MMAILGLLYLVVPILAIVALVRIARLEREWREGQARDAARQKWLKERLEALGGAWPGRRVLRWRRSRRRLSSPRSRRSR
jgi:hypothetical protein